MQTVTDEIKRVRRVSKDGGDYIVKCPHCRRIMGVEGNDLSEILGEQYHDSICGGWLEIDHGATFVREL